MLDLRQLRHVTVLARRLNYVRAADELGITQPTLTRSIQALERRLDVRLFDRDRGGVALTPQGRQIAERAGFLLADAEELERHARQHGRGESGRVRFGMAPMPARALLRHVLADRLNQAPTVTNEVVVRDVEALWSMLLAGDIEFFVSPNPPVTMLPRARAVRLGIVPLSLFVRRGHPLLRGTEGDARYPLLRSSWTGVPIPVEFETRFLGDLHVIEDFETLAGLTAATDAVWFASPLAVREELEAGALVELRRAPERTELMLYSLNRRSQSPAAQAIEERLRHHVARLND